MGVNKVAGQHVGTKRAAIDGTARAVDHWSRECPKWRQMMAEIESTLEKLERNRSGTRGRPGSHRGGGPRDGCARAATAASMPMADTLQAGARRGRNGDGAARGGDGTKGGAARARARIRAGANPRRSPRALRASEAPARSDPERKRSAMARERVVAERARRGHRPGGSSDEPRSAWPALVAPLLRAWCTSRTTVWKRRCRSRRKPRMAAMSRLSKSVPTARAMPWRRVRTMWPASSAANIRTGPGWSDSKRRGLGTLAASATGTSRARKDFPHIGSPPMMPTAWRRHSPSTVDRPLLSERTLRQRQRASIRETGYRRAAVSEVGSAARHSTPGRSGGAA